MSLVRRIARPLLAAPFIFEGVQTAIRPDRVLDALPVTIADIDEQVSKSPLPTDAETILRTAGGLAAVAGAAFALNKKPRLASATLLLTTTVGLAGRKRVWELKGTERTEELRAIAGDLGLLGGILLAAVDTDGKPSLAYRVDKAIERAQKNIWLSTPYFVPDGKLLEPLRAAAARGVDVRLMLPEQSNHVVVDWVARGFYQDLLDAGVRIFLYTPAMNHSKIATIDGMWATVGTANLDRLSLALNYETNLEVADPAFAEALEKVFEADFKDCFEVDPEKWKVRAGIEKITEKLLVPLRPIM